MSTLYISTSGLLTIDLELKSTWRTDGKPLITCSGEIIPKDILIQQIIYPSGLITDPIEAQDMFDAIYYDDIPMSNPKFNSGIYYTKKLGDSENPLLSSFDNIDKSSENTYFQHIYCIRYDEANSASLNPVYDAVTNFSSGVILTKASQPFANNLDIIMSGVPINATDTKLYINMKHNIGLTNYDINNSKYFISILDTDNNINYDIDGNIIPGSGTIINSGVINDTINMILPYSYMSSNGYPVRKNYTIGIKYYDQENTSTKTLTFNTNEINNLNTGIDKGTNNEFDISAKFLESYTIEADTNLSDKRRLVLDVDDIALAYDKYSTTGTYISKYYNLDVPLYTIILLVKDVFPNNISSNSIKYYIEIENDKKIRISPANKNAEFEIINGEKHYIPKMLVLDKLNIQNITSDIKELDDISSIYSFRVVIDFDITAINGTLDADGYYTPPFVDSYECHITDKESFLRI